MTKESNPQKVYVMTFYNNGYEQVIYAKANNKGSAYKKAIKVADKDLSLLPHKTFITNYDELDQSEKDTFKWDTAIFAVEKVE